MRKLALTTAIMLLSACSPGLQLNTTVLEQLPRETEPLYTLIYFVGIDHSDVRRAVILDLEEDDYLFRPEVIDFQYEILQNVSLPESIYETEVFFRQEGVAGYNKASVHSPDGQLIGYELRPLYSEEFMGIPDLLNMSYFLQKDNSIRIKIQIKKSLKRLLYKH